VFGWDLGRTLGVRRVFTDGGRDAQTLRLESNIASRTVGVSRIINRDAGPDCSGVRIDEPCSGQFSSVKALGPMLGAAVLACELAGLPWSSIHLSKLKILAKRPGLIGSTGASNRARAVWSRSSSAAQPVGRLNWSVSMPAPRAEAQTPRKSRVRRNEYRQPIQADLGRPDFRERFHFRLSEIYASSHAIPPRCRGAYRDRHEREVGCGGRDGA